MRGDELGQMGTIWEHVSNWLDSASSLAVRQAAWQRDREVSIRHKWG